MRKDGGKGSTRGIGGKLGVVCALLSLAATQCSTDSGGDTSGGAHTRPDSAPQIIAAFQNSCPGTIGTWTETALKHTQALQAMFQNLADNHPCKPLQAQILAIEQYSASLEKILADQDFNDLKIKEESLKNLTSAYLDAANDPAGQASLHDAMVALQIDIAEKRAQFAVDKDADKRTRFQNYANRLADYTFKLIDNAGQLDACLKESPETAIQLASNLIAIGSSVVSPVVGAGARLISSAIGAAIASSQVAMPQDAFWKLYQNQLPTAFNCGLEAMTEFYCQAGETFDIATHLAQADDPAHPTFPENPIREDLQLYSDHVPLLVDWLRELRNGLPPSDKYDAERQNAAAATKELVEAQSRVIRSELTTMLRLYKATSEKDGKARESLLVNFVRDAAMTAIQGEVNSYGGRSGNGAFQVLTTDPRKIACWVVLDYDAKCPETADNSGVSNISDSTVEQYVRTSLLNSLEANVEALSDHWTSVVKAATAQADATFFDANSFDVRGLMQRARECNAKSPCPVAILEKIRDFLNKMQARPDLQEGRLETVRNTLQMVNRALEIIHVLDPTPVSRAPRPRAPDPDEGVRQQIASLYELFQLRNGPEIFARRVGDLIQYDLNDRLARGEIQDGVGDILNALGGDIRTRLLGGKAESQMQLLDDLNEARRLTAGDIGVFVHSFAPALGWTVEDLARKSAPPLELPFGPNRPNGQKLGQLCSLILSATPQDSLWPEEIPWPICAQASYTYSSPPGPNDFTLSFRVEDQRKELADATRPEERTVLHRMCEYHRFVRAVRIREVFNDLTKTGQPGATAASRLRPELLGLQR